MKQWTHIMIHHSATEDGPTVSWGAIEDYHRKTNGWLDIGYNFGVEEIAGRVYTLVGRSLELPGAHCYQQNMNNKAIGICVVGNYDDVEPSAAILDLLVKRLLKPLMSMYKIPKENIVFHRDFAPKTCPGTKFTKDMVLGRL